LTDRTGESASSDATPPWLFDEYRGYRWLDAAEVEAYEQTIRPDPAAERALLTSLGVSKEHTLIDLGAGTGALVLEAAPLCRSVIAVDPSGAMLDYMRSKAERLGITNITYARKGFLTYDHTDSPVDFVVTRHALHHLPDFWKVEALRRIHTLLKPRGIFHLRELVYSFEPADAPSAIQRWISRVPADSATGLTRAFFEEHVREKYSTYSWLLEAMLRKVGFDIQAASYTEDETHARYLCVKRPA
jgi:ubiquinone/menaquinone biosynthesis C-methylase UbiE